ncbi:hypothetical protein VRU48_13610 [Pedobacter sp. KR3-3]|uniref:Uncharacterized protein n=1 Tax=Pedobacter albus TaxID=3113905 RepID=A0ABU7I9J3_9SPHI|nr:hypothetical protein [Pedobacter sp. KR3-3]MEE1946154.1 hypothetical protein [Pedobacter sp. KR3-3]
MIVKLDGSERKFLGKGFDRDTVKEMVKGYRKDPTNGDPLRYSHFTIHEVLSLFVANNVLNGLITEADLVKNEEVFKKYGLKIYLGRHVSETSLDGLPPEIKGDYKNKITTILCNTEVNRGFFDILKKKNFVAYAEGRKSVEPGQALDQAEIAPPYNIGVTDPTGEQDINNMP